MKKQKVKQLNSLQPPSHLHEHIWEGLFILAIILAVFCVFALFTYEQADLLPTAPVLKGHISAIHNAVGKVGAWFAAVTLAIFGYAAYLIPVAIIYGGWIGFSTRKTLPVKINKHALGIRSTGFLLATIAACGIASLYLSHTLHWLVKPGGIIGAWVSQGLLSLFNYLGSSLILLAGLLFGITLATGLSWLKLLDVVGRFALRIFQQLQKYFTQIFQTISKSSESPIAKVEPNLLPQLSIKKHAQHSNPNASTKSLASITAKAEPTIDEMNSIELEDEPSKVQPLPTPKQAPKVTAAKAPEAKLPAIKQQPGLPSLELLDLPKVAQHNSYTNEALEIMSREVEARLSDFGIQVQVVAVHPGPVITRFEMQLAPGIKVSKISGLAKDLARSLSVTSVRIVEVIPGKAVVGLELPNEVREIVRLREILAAQPYIQAASPLSLALGKDIAGHPVVVDLAKMPHLLVAGTTGSGKSVGVNAMLLSLLYKATPQEVRLIMIDPKMLELSIYEGIPHLLAPVVTDMKEAANALRWCVAEMDRRYRLMATLGVRNLAGYNQKIKDAQEQGRPIMDPSPAAQAMGEPVPLSTMPFVVVIVDEFADMIMVVGKKVEELIARIAQKARAAGIHMILATQRPSVDVITGLIKANVPTRIAFQVSSKIDSRTILDQQGAEQLLGHGDMLYLAPGTGVPIRVHGAFVADHEVHHVVADWKTRGAPEYVDEILQTFDPTEAEANPEGGAGNEADPLYDQAVQIVLQTRRASISNIQRRLKIGYNRAARMIEDMESAGLVSPMESNGTREVLVQTVES